MALCFPFYRLKHYLRARFFTVPILILAPLYNMPRFFEYEIKNKVYRFCANYSDFVLSEAEYDNLTAADVALCAGDWESREAILNLGLFFRGLFPTISRAAELGTKFYFFRAD